MAGSTHTGSVALNTTLLSEWQALIAELAILDSEYGPRLSACCDRALELDRATGREHPHVEDIQNRYGWEAVSELFGRLTPTV